MVHSHTSHSQRFWFVVLPCVVLLAAWLGVWLGSSTYVLPDTTPTSDITIKPAPGLPRYQSATFGPSPASVQVSPLPQTEPVASPQTVGHDASPSSYTSAASRQDQRALQYLSRVRSQTPFLPEAVDPYLPGHSISASGQRVFIESIQFLPQANQHALDVAIIPEADSSPLAAPIDNPISPRTTPRPSRSINPRIGVGFTEEELAFRAKWGWAAHNAALRAAFEEANR